MSLTDDRSAAVVGGGIIGLSIAWRLAQRGLSVTIYEKGHLGAEASWAGAGMLAPGGEFEEASELAHLALESRRLYPTFVRELTERSGFAIDFQELGAVDLAYSDAELARLHARAAAQASLGIVAKPVSPERATTFWPRIRREELKGAYFYPGDGLVNPREVVVALTAACRALDVRIAQHCAVVEIDSAKIITDTSTETYDVTVIAAGAWSSSVRLRSEAPLPEAKPIKGHLIGYQQPEQTCNTIIRHSHTYLAQRASGLLIVGASTEHVGFDRSIQPAVVDELARQGGFVMPHLLETTPSEKWMGFRPGSDQLRLGQWLSTNVYLAYGHYRNGILLAPLTAARLVQEISS